MKYKLTIIKYEENKNYEAEMAKYQEEKLRNSRYGMMESREPNGEKAERSLEVFLTEEEYKKVKEEVIKIFK